MQYMKHIDLEEEEAENHSCGVNSKENTKAVSSLNMVKPHSKENATIDSFKMHAKSTWSMIKPLR